MTAQAIVPAIIRPASSLSASEQNTINSFIAQAFNFDTLGYLPGQVFADPYLSGTPIALYTGDPEVDPDPQLFPQTSLLGHVNGFAVTTETFSIFGVHKRQDGGSSYSPEPSPAGLSVMTVEDGGILFASRFGAQTDGGTMREILNFGNIIFPTEFETATAIAETDAEFQVQLDDYFENWSGWVQNIWGWYLALPDFDPLGPNDNWQKFGFNTGAWTGAGADCWVGYSLGTRRQKTRWDTDYGETVTARGEQVFAPGANPSPYYYTYWALGSAWRLADDL